MTTCTFKARICPVPYSFISHQPQCETAATAANEKSCSSFKTILPHVVVHTVEKATRVKQSPCWDTIYLKQHRKQTVMQSVVRFPEMAFPGTGRRCFSPTIREQHDNTPPTITLIVLVKMVIATRLLICT